MPFTLTPIDSAPKPKARRSAVSGPWESYGPTPSSKPWARYAAPRAAPLRQGEFGAGIEAAALRDDPNLEVTGRSRTPWRNYQVGGVQDSAHMTDNARDFAPRKGESLQAAEARLQKEFGPKGYKVILEGAGSAHSTGPHIHIEATAQSQQLDVPKPWERYGESSPGAPQKRSQAPRPQDTTPAPNRAQRPVSKDPSLASSLWTGIKRLPGDAVDTVKGMGEAVAHPGDTLKSILTPVAGAGIALMDEADKQFGSKGHPPISARGRQAEAAFHSTVDPWLNHPWSQFKKEVREDPIGLALTVAPAGRLVGKLGVRGVDAARLAKLSPEERVAWKAKRAEDAKLATRTKNVFRTVLSRHDLDAQRAAHEMEKHQAVVGNAPVEHQRAIISAVESASSGGIERLPEKYRPAARAIRDVALKYRRRIEDVLSANGKEAPRFIEDYYARMWKQRPSEVRAALARQGSGRNLKARRIPTYQEGLDAGLTPVHENPLAGMTAYAQNMSRFLATHDLQNRLRGERLAKWVPKHNVPEGWRKLDGINTEREAGGLSKEVNGVRVHTGDKPALVLAAPEPVASIWNRHVDKGLRSTVEDKFGRGAGRAVAGAEKASHVLGSAKLAFSAFHPVLIAGKGVASDMGNALRHFTRGAPADTVKSLAHMPFAPVATAVEGFRMGKRMLRGDEAMSHLDKLYRDAGGRIGPADVYRSTLSPSLLQSAMRGTFKRDLGDALAKVGASGTPAAGRIKATLDLGARVLESWNDVVFRHYVPMMKRGAFERELATSLKAHPEWSHAQQMAEARRVLSSIDGRMGEISRDNLFWSRTAHQLGRMLLLSPSWQVGDVRVLTQAAGELPGSVRGLLKGRGISQGPAQAAGLVGSFMLANAIGNYLFTGQPPKDMRDLEAFRTGGTNRNDGSPERAQAPSIMKDFFGFANDPQREVSNKLHPALKTALEVYDNRDWRNLPIVRPSDALADGSSRVHDALSYAGDSLLPIPFSDNPNGANSHLSALAQLAGLRPVGSEYTNPERYEATRSRLAEKAWQDKKRADAKAEARKR